MLSNNQSPIHLRIGSYMRPQISTVGNPPHVIKLVHSNVDYRLFHRSNISAQYVCQNIRVKVMVFNATINNISVISWRSILFLKETGVHVENYRPATNQWQTLSQICFQYTSAWESFEFTILVVSALIALVVVNPTTIWSRTRTLRMSGVVTLCECTVGGHLLSDLSCFQKYDTLW